MRPLGNGLEALTRLPVGKRSGRDQDADFKLRATDWSTHHLHHVLERALLSDS